MRHCSTRTRSTKSSSSEIRSLFGRVRNLREHAQFAISAITRYELIRGLKEKQATRQLVLFEVFCRKSLVIPVTDAILERTADLWVEARRGGFPGKDADLLIAATALETQRVLVTGNTAHFIWVPSLKIENWRMP